MFFGEIVLWILTSSHLSYLTRKKLYKTSILAYIPKLVSETSYFQESWENFENQWCFFFSFVGFQRHIDTRSAERNYIFVFPTCWAILSPDTVSTDMARYILKQITVVSIEIIHGFFKKIDECSCSEKTLVSFHGSCGNVSGWLQNSMRTHIEWLYALCTCVSMTCRRKTIHTVDMWCYLISEWRLLNIKNTRVAPLNGMAVLAKMEEGGYCNNANLV